MKTVGELKKVLRQRGLLQENTENLKNRQALENDRRCMDYGMCRKRSLICGIRSRSAHRLADL